MTDTPAPSLSVLDTATLRPSAGPRLQTASLEDARQSADEFESFFVARMVEIMYQGLSTEAPFGGGSGEKAYQSFLIDAYADAIVDTGGIGLADQVYAELTRLQIAQSDPAPQPNSDRETV